MSLLKQAKTDLVVESVKQIMLEKGINNLKISDIAKELSIGEATIYRYFGTKTNLVIEVGVSLWEDIYQQLSHLEKMNTGFESVRNFFFYFLEGYKSSRNVFRFLDEFDALMVKEEVSQTKLLEYDKKLLKVKQIFDQFYEQGVKDNSILNSIDKDQFYFTTTHMIMGICERLATAPSIVPSDEIVNDLIQIELALDICTNYIKNERENK